MRIGLFGGTFDPPHIGHLIVAQDARVRLGLDRVVFIPAAEPPHKRDRSISSAAARLAMLEAAIGDDPRFAIDDVELKRRGPSYTVDTLRAYRKKVPDHELFLLVGADQFLEIDTWHEADALADLARVAVLSRAGERRARTSARGIEPVYVDVTRIDLSATDVRRRAAAGEPIRYLVPAPVLTLIEEHRLYRDPLPVAARTGAQTPG